ncbi:MAG: ABC transporter permease [Clostridia bacterium]
MSETAVLKQRKTLGSRVSKFTKDYAIVLAILVLVVIFSIASPYFFSYKNLRNILQQTTSLAIVCIGQALIITTGQFDLSLGQNVCLTSCAMAWLIKFGGWNPWLAILAAIVVGMSVGACNGLLIAYARIPCFIVTLGFQMICKGTSKIITNATPIPGMPESIQFFGRGFIGGAEWGVPISVAMMIVMFVIAMFVTTRTKFGRCLYAMGGGEEAAYFAGIDVKKYRALVYTIAGGLCAISSVVLVTRLDSAALTNGSLYEFDSTIACILGGISLAGGRGKIVQGLFGAIFLMLFFNGMTMMNVNPFVQDVLKGVVMIGAVALDVVRNKRK